jgi:predicted transcriptional regulator
MATGTVRIPAAVHQKLRQMAAESGMSLSRTLERAVETLRRQTLLEKTNRAYAALRADPHRWAEEQTERTAWEATLPDGLKDD